MDRRDFIKILGAGAAAGIIPACASTSRAGDPYEVPAFGNVRLLHFTDSHAQLQPIYFREPNVNIGVGGASARPPHLVGENLLAGLRMPVSDMERHALTYLDFQEAINELLARRRCSSVWCDCSQTIQLAHRLKKSPVKLKLPTVSIGSCQRVHHRPCRHDSQPQRLEVILWPTMHSQPV